MSDHNFYLHDSVHILRSNGTTEHAEAVEWAVSRIALLESVLAEAGEALEPFKDEAAKWVDRLPDDQPMSVSIMSKATEPGDMVFEHIPLRAFRRAASVSNQIAGMKEERE